MKEGDISEIIESSNHVFVFSLISKDNFDELYFNSIKDSLSNQLLLNKRNQTYNNWLRSEKNNIEIVDLRHKIF